MADNYCEFSELLQGLTEPEKNWWDTQLETIEVYAGVEYDEDDVPAQLQVERKDAEYHGVRILRNWPGATKGYEEDLGCLYEWTADGDLWLHSENCNTDKIAYFMQQFLKTHRPDDCWSTTLAEYCSKPRLGEFGGGAIFVTAEEIKWVDTSEFISRCQTEFKEPQEETAPTMLSSTYVETFSVPALGHPPEARMRELVEIRRLEDGALVGFDGGYLEDLADGEQPYNPYAAGVQIEVPSDEPKSMRGWPHK
jgi:hypothetical protein